jgi:hypothetical protein
VCMTLGRRCLAPVTETAGSPLNLPYRNLRQHKFVAVCLPYAYLEHVAKVPPQLACSVHCSLHARHHLQLQVKQAQERSGNLGWKAQSL